MGKISADFVLDTLAEKFGEVSFNATEPYGLLTIEVSLEEIQKVLYFLKSDDRLQFNFLTDLTAVHYPETEGREFAVVYLLHSFTNNLRLRVKTFLNKNSLQIPTTVKLWDGANWMERETYDFFGIIFDGHPDLRRILNVDDMTVFPMRKEYPLEDPNRVDKKDYFFGR